jgi:hypothetical protein
MRMISPIHPHRPTNQKDQPNHRNEKGCPDVVTGHEVRVQIRLLVGAGQEHECPVKRKVGRVEDDPDDRQVPAHAAPERNQSCDQSKSKQDDSHYKEPRIQQGHRRARDREGD